MPAIICNSDILSVSLTIYSFRISSSPRLRLYLNISYFITKKESTFRFSQTRRDVQQNILERRKVLFLMRKEVEAPQNGKQNYITKLVTGDYTSRRYLDFPDVSSNKIEQQSTAVLI